MEPERNVRPN